MSKVLVAPDNNASKPQGYRSLFLAGGITNCPDWQAEVIEKLQDYKVLIYNPRRKDSPIGDLLAAEEQIKWEFEHLRDADMLLFWFSEGSDNPIVLFEYGRHGFSSTRPIFLGADLEYKRRSDVIIQTKLARGSVDIFGSIDGLVNCVASKLEKEYRPKAGKQMVTISRFVRSNQGELRDEGKILLEVSKKTMELSTFRMCCSDFLVENDVWVVPFLNRQFVVAYKTEDGAIKLAHGTGGFSINLASYDPAWCRKCGAEVQLAAMPGPICGSCGHGVNGAI